MALDNDKTYLDTCERDVYFSEIKMNYSNFGLNVFCTLREDALNIVLKQIYNQKYSKLVEMEGFRKGKVPFHLFVKNFNTSMLEEDVKLFLASYAYITMGKYDFYPFESSEAARIEFTKNGDLDCLELSTVGCSVPKEYFLKITDKERSSEAYLDDDMSNIVAIDFGKRIEDRLFKIFWKREASEDATVENDLVLLALQASHEETNTTIEAWSSNRFGVKLGTGFLGKDFDTKFTRS